MGAPHHCLHLMLSVTLSRRYAGLSGADHMISPEMAEVSVGWGGGRGMYEREIEREGGGERFYNLSEI